MKINENGVVDFIPFPEEETRQVMSLLKQAVDDVDEMKFFRVMDCAKKLLWLYNIFSLSEKHGIEGVPDGTFSITEFNEAWEKELNEEPI